MSTDDDFVEQEIAAAAAEAGHIGGDIAADDGVDEAHRAVSEGGGGESEGFELAEQELIEHASHADQHTPEVILHHPSADEEPNPGRVDGEADQESGDDD